MKEKEKENENIMFFSHDGGIAKYLHTLFSGEGYNITGVSEKEISLDELIEKKIDILILDIEGTNAVEICKKIRSSFTLRHPQ